MSFDFSFQMCMRENSKHEISKNEDLTRKVTKIDESLEETHRKLDLVCMVIFSSY